MICSTLSGALAIKNPDLGVLVREDGLILNRVQGSNKGDFRYAYTPGCFEKVRGYYVIRIRGKLFQAHRIVAETFQSNPDNKPTVDHINRIRTDNRACNLRWATYHEQSENNSLVINRADYGVRWSEDLKQYKKNWRVKNAEHCREYFREYARQYRKHKKEGKLNASLPKERPSSKN